MNKPIGKFNPAIATGAAADNKKVVFAGILITIMIGMWARVFLKKASAKPVTVEQQVVQAMNETQSQQPNQLSQGLKYKEMPELIGRSDKLHTDFFDISHWPEFAGDTSDDTSVDVSVQGTQTASSTREADLKQAAGQLKLEAILNGSNPEAFINGNIYRQAQIIRLSHDDEVYEYQIVSIDTKSVVLKSSDVSIVLRMLDDDSK